MSDENRNQDHDTISLSNVTHIHYHSTLISIVRSIQGHKYPVWKSYTGWPFQQYCLEVLNHSTQTSLEHNTTVVLRRLCQTCSNAQWTSGSNSAVDPGKISTLSNHVSYTRSQLLSGLAKSPTQVDSYWCGMVLDTRENPVDITFYHYVVYPFISCSFDNNDFMYWLITISLDNDFPW